MSMERRSEPSLASVAWRSPALLLAAAMLPLFWAAYFVNSFAEETRAIEHAKSHSASLAQIFQENTERIFLGVDRSLRLLRSVWEKDPDAFDLKAWAENASLVAGSTVQIGVIGPDGFAKQTTVDYNGPPLYIGNREHFIKGATLDRDALYISKPVIGRASKRWVIQLVRRLQYADGRFAGVLVGSIDPDRVGEFLSTEQLGDKGAVILRNADNIILAARGISTPVMGDDRRSSLQGALETAMVGNYWGAGAIDGVNRLVSYRKSSVLPLIFSVGLAEEDVFAEYRRHQQILLSCLIVFTVALILGTVFDIRRRFALVRTQHDLESMALRFKNATENMSQGLTMFDADCRLVAHNKQYLQVYGMPADAVHIGRSYHEILAERRAASVFNEDPNAYAARLMAHLAQSQRLERTTTLTDGRIIQVVSCPKDDGGWVSTHEDITERRRAEDELAAMKNFLDTIIQNMPVPIAIRDAQSRRFILVNRAYEAFVEKPREEIIGTTVFDHYSEEVASGATGYDTQSLESDGQIVTNEFTIDTKSNGRRVVFTTRIAVRDRNQQPQYIIAMINDITERKSSEAKIAQLAHYDALTDLANRNLFRDQIDQCLAKLRQQHAGFAVFLLDLDRFKAVNDALGHQAGDALLREVAGRIKASIRGVDVAARLGGDEFALIVQPGDGTLADSAAALAANLIDAISMPYEIEGQTIAVGCSIGVALAPEHGEKSDQLLKNADLALYKSKEAGRNCFHLYREEFKDEADRRDALENDLRTAIWREEFELFYQPIIEVETGKVRAVEALMRWRHPTRGLIAPNHFIPLAEETGLIVALGEWAINKACQDATRMPADVTVSVNLSPIQFAKSSLVDAVILALVESQLPPERLELEITENVLLKETETNLEILRQLKNLGVSIALDDFGVGYSSLGYLTSFPFDKVKIDRSFVEKLDRAESKAVISSIVQLSHSLHLITTAEGIETPAQFEEIKALGITLCQGYLLARPAPLAEIDLTSIRSVLKTEAA